MAKRAYCDYCGRIFTPKFPGDTICPKCRKEMEGYLSDSEFDLYAQNGMKKKITGEFNQYNREFFTDYQD